MNLDTTIAEGAKKYRSAESSWHETSTERWKRIGSIYYLSEISSSDGVPAPGQTARYQNGPMARRALTLHERGSDRPDGWHRPKGKLDRGEIPQCRYVGLAHQNGLAGLVAQDKTQSSYFLPENVPPSVRSLAALKGSGRQGKRKLTYGLKHKNGVSS